MYPLSLLLQSGMALSALAEPFPGNDALYIRVYLSTSVMLLDGINILLYAISAIRVGLLATS